MDFKPLLSERCIQILDNCLSEFETWHFDAINGPLLLEHLALEEESNLEEYLLNKGLDLEFDDLDSYTLIYLGDRQNQLKINEDIEEEEVEEAKDNNLSSIDIEEDSTPDEVYELYQKLIDTGKQKKVSIVVEPFKNSKSNISKVKKKEPQYNSEHDDDLICKDENGNSHKYPIAEETVIVFNKLNSICKENKLKFVRPIHIMSAMFAAELPELKRLFAELDFNFVAAKKYFTSAEAFRLGIIPYSLSGFMTCLNDKVNIKKPCEILMRDNEVEQIWNISLKKNKRNTIIVGEAGVGKSALIEKMTYDIVKGNCPNRFKDFVVISLDVNSLIAGTTFRGQAEERIKNLVEFLEEQDNVILFIDEVHTILGAGSCFEGEMDLANALKPILARGDTIVIGATTDREYEMYFARDAALSRRFEKVVVDEPLAKDVYPMIKNKIRALSEFHNVKISKEIVEYAILIANCFSFDKKNPDKTLDLLDRSMVSAYRSNKQKVDKECILKNFGIYFDLFNGMDKESRKEVAYHELGHYLVGKFSNKLTDLNMLAISIMPAERYVGVTCYEYRKDILPFKNKQYYIDAIAFELGGKVTEYLFRKDFTSGTSGDLESANKLAFDVITKYGMSTRNNARNNIFVNDEDYPMFSEQSINSINQEVKELVDVAYKRAEDIIFEYKELLEILVKILLKKQIMSEIELDKICKQYMEKNK